MKLCAPEDQQSTMNCFWKTVFIAFSHHVFVYITESSVLSTITVVLNDTVTLRFSGSCDGIIEWKHRHESESAGVKHTTVATLHQGDFTPRVGFENRVKRGWFECHCGKTQEDVKVVVLAPIVANLLTLDLIFNSASMALLKNKLLTVR